MRALIDMLVWSREVEAYRDLLEEVSQLREQAAYLAPTDDIVVD